MIWETLWHCHLLLFFTPSLGRREGRQFFLAMVLARVYLPRKSVTLNNTRTWEKKVQIHTSHYCSFLSLLMEAKVAVIISWPLIVKWQLVLYPGSPGMLHPFGMVPRPMAPRKPSASMSLSFAWRNQTDIASIRVFSVRLQAELATLCS